MKYLGGDKPSDKIMATDCVEAVAYKNALVDLVKTVGILISRGKTLKDFVN